MAGTMSSTSSKHTTIRLVLLLGAAVTLFALIAYYNAKKGGNERFASSSAAAPADPGQALTGSPSPSYPPMALMAAPAPAPAKRASVSGAPSPVEPFGNESLLGVPGASAGSDQQPNFLKDAIRPDELLPKDAANSQWAMANPAGQGDLKDQNFLTAGYHLGFDTQGNSLKNASHDIRSSPPNPRYRVSIWQQSSIEPDLNRRPLE